MADSNRPTSPPILPAKGTAGATTAAGGAAAAAANRAAAKKGTAAATTTRSTAPTVPSDPIAAQTAKAPAANAQSIPTAATKSSRPRAQRQPDDMLYWDGARDGALIKTLKSGPVLSAKEATRRLKDHEAFVADATLLDGTKGVERVRIRVKKLNKRLQNMGYESLPMKRSSHSGYDPDETLRALLGEGGNGGNADQVRREMLADPDYDNEEELDEDDDDDLEDDEFEDGDEDGGGDDADVPTTNLAPAPRSSGGLIQP